MEKQKQNLFSFRELHANVLSVMEVLFVWGFCFFLHEISSSCVKAKGKAIS